MCAHIRICETDRVYVRVSARESVYFTVSACLRVRVRSACVHITLLFSEWRLARVGSGWVGIETNTQIDVKNAKQNEILSSM